MANVLGTVLVVLEAQTTAFARGMQDAKALSFRTSGEIVDSLGKIGESLEKLKFGNTQQWTKSGEIVGAVIAGIGIAAATAAVVVAKETAEQIQSLNKLSQSYGLNIETLSSLRVASAITGVSMETLANGMGRLARASAAAANPHSMQAQAFTEIGISATDATGKLKPMDTLLPELADKFSKMETGTGKTALAMQLFGRDGAAMIPFLNLGAAGIEKFIAMAKEMGLTISQQDLQQAAQLTTSLEILGLRADGFKEQFSLGFIPALNAVAIGFSNVGTSGASLGRTLGESVGTAVIALAKGFEILTATMAAAIVIGNMNLGDLLHLGEVWDQIKGINDELLKNLKAIDGGKQEATKMAAAAAALNPEVVKAQQAIAKLDAQFKSGMISGEAYFKANKAAVAVYNEAYNRALANPLAIGGAPAIQGPATKTKPDSGLSEILNQTTSILDKNNTLQAQIDKIGELQQKITDFRDKHPEQVFLDINRAAEELDSKLKTLIYDQTHLDEAVQHMGLAKMGEVFEKMPPPPLPVVSGQVSEQAKELRGGGPTGGFTSEEQQAERSRIYEQSLTPLQKYTQAVAHLNELYKDKSEPEYIAGMRDAKEALVGAYDPTIKLQKAIAALNDLYKSGAISEANFASQLRQLNAEMAMEKTKTAPQPGLSGIGQGIGAGAQQVASQWTGLPNETANATAQTLNKMSGQFATFFDQIILGTKTAGKAFAELGRNMLTDVVGAIVQMIVQWLIFKAVTAIGSALGVGNPAQQQLQQTSKANAGIGISYAGVAAAEAFAYYMPEGLPVALAMSAVAESIGLTFAGQAASGAAGAAEKGGLMDRDGPIFAHAKELILPPALSQHVMQTAGMYHGDYAGSAKSGTTNHHWNFAINGATDAQAVGDEVMDRVQRYFKTGGVMK